jgi:hypothetical protein
LKVELLGYIIEGFRYNVYENYPHIQLGEKAPVVYSGEFINISFFSRITVQAIMKAFSRITQCGRSRKEAPVIYSGGFFNCSKNYLDMKQLLTPILEL